MCGSGGAIGRFGLAADHGHGRRAIDQQEKLRGHCFRFGKATGSGQFLQIGQQALLVQQRDRADFTVGIADLAGRIDEGAAVEIRRGKPAAQQWKHRLQALAWRALAGTFDEPVHPALIAGTQGSGHQRLLGRVETVEALSRHTRGLDDGVHAGGIDPPGIHQALGGLQQSEFGGMIVKHEHRPRE